ncbi:glyoxalase-like domain-containing protein [Ampelomyces quisqualis]|uniref:Glyoxalase-like domain-containing protein n=1 Tax=Ampelomyces quisqualis TaxID=50730 RepID=A0A6A5Q7L2_AMPQU|nr:glyoxalase-like domain-containing protein [Ampelomyces quisqualis]
MAQTQSLDHLILFVPVNPETKLPHLESFYEKNFRLTPGGFHADGITSNTLILLADGCYIELISFVDASKAPCHWWGPDATFTGWKDWCLTNPKSPEENYIGVKDTHDEPVRGGRKRADGVDVKWAVTFPKVGRGVQNVRGRIPFFCHDITQRNVRVPLSEENTKHPCGALGVMQLTVIVKDEALLDETNSAYRSIIGRDGTTKGDEVSFQLGRVCNAAGLGGGASIVLRLPRAGRETEAASRTGFWYGNVILGAPASSEKTVGTRERLDSGEDDLRGIWVEYV